MSIVIDTSVALKCVVEEPGTEAAVALRIEDLIAPALWFAEAANALWRRTQIGEIAAAEAVERFFEFANAPVASVAMEPHLDRALALPRQSAIQFTTASISRLPCAAPRHASGHGRSMFRFSR